MRKINSVISVIILVLFFIHSVMGGFQLIGIISGGNAFMQLAAYVMAVLIFVHLVIGIKLTADTLKSEKKSGVSYSKANKLFWIRRISGFLIMLFVLFHMMIFVNISDGAYRLKLFDFWGLFTQICLVLSVAVHIISNIKPLEIAFGIRTGRSVAGDIIFVITVLLLFSAAGFVIYFLRWLA
jgi:succinate dehydrogenase/fumarate reductase cytochrome b subunit